MMPSILFVCTGNICRSPLAEALFKYRLAGRPDEAGWQVDSAGTWAMPGQPASEKALQVLARRGLEASAHRSQVVSAELLSGFDLILVMESGHKEALQAEFPAVARKVFMLTELAGLPYDVADPYGSSIQDYEDTAGELEGLLSQALPKILQLLAGQDR